MDIALKLHQSLTKGANSHELLDLFNSISGKDTLAMINEYFMEHYNMTPNEYISENFRLDEIYAISSTLKYIREPNETNNRSRARFYKKIGYTPSTTLK